MNLSEIHAGLASIIAQTQKEAFAPAPGGVPLTPEAASAPPMDPSMMGAPPMDPAMMGGMPPMDPAMMGGMPPMDPAMMGGMPPMDPSMMGAPPMDPAMMGMPPMDPAMMGAPPMDPAALEGMEVEATIPMKVEDVKQLLDTAMKASKMLADVVGKNNGVAGEATGDKNEARMAAIEDQLAALSDALGLPAIAPEANAPEMPVAPPETKVASYNGFEDITRDLDAIMRSLGN